MPKYPNFKTESEDRGDGSVDEGLLSKHKEGPDFESKHQGKGGDGKIPEAAVTMQGLGIEPWVLWQSSESP